MKNPIKILSILVLGLGFLVGCSSGATVPTEQFVVGMECNYAPWNWTQSYSSNTAVDIGGGQYCDGYDVQVAQHIAQDTGRQLVIKKTSWDGLILALQSGEIDAIIAGMSPTDERKQEVDFSDPYYIGEFGVIVKKDGNYASATSVNDFTNAKITAQMGTSHVALRDQMPGIIEATIMKDFPTMTVALSSGEIDGFITEGSTGKSIPQSNPDLTYLPISDFVLDPTEIAVSVGIKKGNTELLNEVNASLANLSVEERNQLMDAAILGESSDTTFFGAVGSIISNNYMAFINGAMVTLLISIFATIFGFLLGLLVSIIRTNKVGSVIANIYITIFRGTPMMVQAMVVFYGMAMLIPGYNWSNIIYGNIIAGIIVVTVNTGAYMAEIIRGGIQSLDVGQFEAAKSLGMTKWETMTNIILPQAIRNVIPAIGNELIVNIKDTSVLNVISVTELFFVSQGIAGSTYKVFQTFFVTAAIYLFLTLVVSLILRVVEKRIDPKNKKRKVSLPTSTTDVKHFID